jgi:hypothetical protein
MDSIIIVVILFGVFIICLTMCATCIQSREIDGPNMGDIVVEIN